MIIIFFNLWPHFKNVHNIFYEMVMMMMTTNEEDGNFELKEVKIVNK